jgi:hypothetical protein
MGSAQLAVTAAKESGQKTMGRKQWAVYSGQWDSRKCAVDSEQWVVDREQGQKAVDSKKWAMWAVGSNSEQLTVGSVQWSWIVGSGPWALNSMQCRMGSGQWAVQ